MIVPEINTTRGRHLPALFLDNVDTRWAPRRLTPASAASTACPTSCPWGFEGGNFPIAGVDATVNDTDHTRYLLNSGVPSMLTDEPALLAG